MNSTTYALVLLIAQILFACTHAADPGRPAAASYEFVGSSPCGALPREFLQIPRTQPGDKITWHLTLSPLSTTNSYKLVATFGLQAHSAPGFIDGGTTFILEGTLAVLPGIKSIPGSVVYEIKSAKSEWSLSFARINDNLLHLLDRDKNLMIGNEFWSYTLNRKGVGQDQ